MKNIATVITLIMVLLLLAGCGTQKEVQKDDNSLLPNPIKESTMEELYERFGVELKAPAGAEDVSYALIESEGIGEMNYALNGASFCCRVAKGEGLRDISGMYYDWKSTVLDSEGAATLNFNPGAEGVISRFCESKGLVCSLSVSSGADKDMLRASFGEVFGMLCAEADDQSGKLLALLETAHTRYFPGTAGSSLSAAACAAEMADFFAESAISPDEADRIIQSYYSSLSAEDVKLFEQQINGVVGAFSNLTAEGGEGLLSDCGYEALHFPWSDENIRNCFVALLGSD